MCIKSDFKEIFFKLATNGQSDKDVFVDIIILSSVSGLSAPAQGLYTSIKSLKNVFKIDFKEFFLKLVTNGQSDKAFLLTSKFCPQWVVCPWGWGYIHEKYV